MSDNYVGEFQYLKVTFEEIIRVYVAEELKKKDWETLAIDPHKRIVVLERFEQKKEE